MKIPLIQWFQACSIHGIFMGKMNTMKKNHGVIFMASQFSLAMNFQ